MLEPKWLRLDNLQVAWINLQVGHNANFKRAQQEHTRKRYAARAWQHVARSAYRNFPLASLSQVADAQFEAAFALK